MTLSKCCKVEAKINCTSDFIGDNPHDKNYIGTCYYICSKCNKACDIDSIGEKEKRIIKGLQEASAGLIEGPFKSVEELLNSIDRKYNILDWIEIYWHRYFWNYVSSIPLEIKSFIQRGIRGYSDRDTWDFDSYLSEVIAGGVQHLILNIPPSDCPQDKGAGFCCECDICMKPTKTEIKRLEDLTEIVKTMQLAQGMYKVHVREEYKEKKKAFRRGMNILIKRWFELWD